MLPPELLDEIFGYLEPKDLFNAILVSHSWEGIGKKRLWGSPAPSAFLTLPLRSAKDRSALVQYLCLRDLDEVPDALKHRLVDVDFPNLRSISYVNTRLTEFTKPFIVKTVLSEKLLHLVYESETHPDSLFALLRYCCPNLRSLRIETRDVMAGRQRGFHDLQHLYALLRQRCTKLVKLTISLGKSDCPGERLPINVLQILAIPQLRHLDVVAILTSGSFKSQADVPISPASVAVLGSLDLSDVQAKHLMALIPHLTAIHKLTVCQSPPKLVPCSVSSLLALL